MTESAYKVISTPKEGTTREAALEVISSLHPDKSVKVLDAGDKWRAIIAAPGAMPPDLEDEKEGPETGPPDAEDLEEGPEEGDEKPKEPKGEKKEKGDKEEKGDPISQVVELFKQLDKLLPKAKELLGIGDEGLNPDGDKLLGPEDVGPVPGGPPGPGLGGPPGLDGPPAPPSVPHVPPVKKGPPKGLLPTFTNRRSKFVSTEPDKGDVTMSVAIAALEANPEFSQYTVEEIKRDEKRSCYHAKLALKCD